jgi:hypothetical protein
MTDIAKQPTPWTVHLAAVVYVLPLICAIPLIGFRAFGFWTVYLPLTALAIYAIYGQHGRFRPLARLYLLVGMLSLHINAYLGNPLAAFWGTPDPMAMVYWSDILLVLSLIGATALTPASTLLWINRETTGKLYPKGLIPQEEIRPVGEEPPSEAEIDPPTSK